MASSSPSTSYSFSENLHRNLLLVTVPSVKIELHLDNPNGNLSVLRQSFVFPLKAFLRDTTSAYSMFCHLGLRNGQVKMVVSEIMSFVRRLVSEPSNINRRIVSVLVRCKIAASVSGADKKVTRKSDKFKVEDSKCPICLEKLSGGATAAKLSCGHVYDDECIKKWLRTHNTCPMCRCEVSVQEKIKQNRENRDRKVTSVSVFLMEIE